MRSQSKHLSLIYEKPLSNKVTKQQHSLVNEIVDVNKAISQHVCNSCESASIIFDEPTGETVCSQCGTVTSERQMAIEKELKIKEKSGMPFSLAYPDKGCLLYTSPSPRDS